MTKKAKICECCGAPLHGYKCEYCGVEYEKPIDYIPQIVVYRDDRDVKTIACKSSIQLESIKYLGKEEAAECVKTEMAHNMTKELLQYLDVETWIDPITMQQTFWGRLKVIAPNEARKKVGLPQISQDGLYGERTKEALRRFKND